MDYIARLYNMVFTCTFTTCDHAHTIYYFVLLLTLQNISLAKFSNTFSTTILAPEACGRERDVCYSVKDTHNDKQLGVSLIPLPKWLTNYTFI